jgi:predicted membrane metal-binding protein
MSAVHAWIYGLVLGCSMEFIHKTKANPFFVILLPFFLFALLHHTISVASPLFSSCRLSNKRHSLIFVFSACWVYMHGISLMRQPVIAGLIPGHFSSRATDNERLTYRAPKPLPGEFHPLKNYIQPFLDAKWKRWNALLKRKVEQTIRQSPLQLQGWLLGLLLGSSEGFSKEIIFAHEFFGIYHTLVISGLHFTLLAHTTHLVLQLPFRILLIFRLINPFYWARVDLCTKVIVALLLLLYCQLLNWPIACQRALIMYWLFGFFSIFMGEPRTWDAVLIGMVLHSILFPLDLFTLSSLLSWGTYLIVLQYQIKLRSASGYLEKAALTFGMQSVLTLYSFSLIGRTSLLALPINIIISPLALPLVLIAFFSVLLLVWFDMNCLTTALMESQIAYLNALEQASLFLSHHFNAVISIEASPLFIKYLLILAAWHFVRGACREIGND